MLYFVSGLVVTGSGAAGLWYCLPHNGQVRPLIVMPVLEWLLPVAIVFALTLGFAMMVSGVLA
jgi:hypothetical protein